MALTGVNFLDWKTDLTTGITSDLSWKDRESGLETSVAVLDRRGDTVALLPIETFNFKPVHLQEIKINLVKRSVRQNFVVDSVTRL